VKHLRHDEVADGIVDRRPQEDDPLLQKTRVDVERALPSSCLLNHHRDHVVLHASSFGPSSSPEVAGSAPASTRASGSSLDPSRISACSTSRSSAFVLMISPASVTIWPVLPHGPRGARPPPL